MAALSSTTSSVATAAVPAPHAQLNERAFLPSAQAFSALDVTVAAHPMLNGASAALLLVVVMVAAPGA